ncbi:hypothetical protein Z043_114233, partial [Scleropages formosus]
TIEKFFSKEIRYLVSDKQEARYVQRLGRSSVVPSPSSASSLSSPHPSNKRGSPKSPVGSERIQINRIISNALDWGVKILYIDDIVSYIEKKKRDFTTSNKVTTTGEKKDTGPTEKSFHKYNGRIRRPFIKVEDSSRHYKPIYLSMPYLPEINFTTEPPCTPFLMEGSGKIVSGKKLKECKTKDKERGDKPYKVKGKVPEAREKKRDVKVAHGQLDVDELHGDNVPVPAAEEEQNPKVLEETSQERTAQTPCSNASETWSSPARSLGKVKSFRRQQKVKKRVPKGALEETDFLSCPLQNLWQLFESSEDMDMEFRGFD